MSHIQTDILPLFKGQGTFIEIGCWDGQHISQTADLEKLGWSGVCVDPFAKNFEQRKCTLVQKAVSKDGLQREFVKVSIDRRYGGDVSYFSGFKDNIAVHWPLISEHCDYEIINIDTVKFSDLPINQHTNFLSVDVEGSELEIFESIDFDKYSFDVVMFEHNGVDNGVGELLQSKGYKLYKSLVIDDIYVNEKFKA